MEGQPYFKSERDVLMHIATLFKLASVDGVFSSEEENFIVALADKYSQLRETKSYGDLLNEAKEVSLEEIDVWLDSLKAQSVSARNLLKDFIVLGYVDGRYCDKETTFVKECAEKLGVSPVMVTKIEKSVLDIITALDAMKRCIDGTD